ncbi:hypothetical protein KZO37_21320 [Rhodococcus fascians]|uniref:hypothetical protein n=1 Tax=Rhodococcoides fascians TaxID=1828 RepID=UPI001C5F7CE3|nr:hypothetical protein [Rhodococcus fascians]MBW4781905.1 hypothetical protein [Rhodococcus fascians]
MSIIAAERRFSDTVMAWDMPREPCCLAPESAVATSVSERIEAIITYGMLATAVVAAVTAIAALGFYRARADPKKMPEKTRDNVASALAITVLCSFSAWWVNVSWP